MAGSSHAIQALYNNWTSYPPNSKQWADIMLDFEKYAEQHIIINKEGNAVLMKLNTAQKEVANLIIKHVLAPIPQPIRLVIHKSRQMGISTVLSLLEEYLGSRKTKINILHMLPTETLAKSYWTEKGEPLWQGTNPDFLPDTMAKTSPTPYITIKKFAGKNIGTNIRYTGSNSKSAMRSTTNQVVILDEYAFFENVSRLEKGVLATQSKTGLSITVYVSTAQGMNHFYDVVKQSNEPNSRMEHLFLPWHMLKEYERPIAKDSRLANLDTYKPTQYDMKLFDIFEKAGYPEDEWLNKIEWYDYVFETEAKGDEDFMRSEYPSTPEESFAASGRPVLPLKRITAWLKQEHPFVAIEPVIDQTSRTSNRIKFVENPRSPIRKYKEPIPGHRYMIGVDCAEGYSGDMSAGVVLDIKDMEEVASFVVDMEQNDLAELVVGLATEYNNAIIVPEKNMAGLFIESVQVLGYWRLYTDPNVRTRDTNKMYGVRTTLATKNEAINRLKFLMNKRIYKAHDKIFMEQAIHYSWKPLPSGGYKAEAVGQDDNGNPWHDDTIAARLVVMMALDFRRFKNYFTKENNG